jgi:hypothetical protein
MPVVTAEDQRFLTPCGPSADGDLILIRVLLGGLFP